MASEQREKLHSAEFFGPERDYWWNRDHLELIASRLGLAAVGSVLDVGCGPGHWGRLLSAVLSTEATVVGIDRERAWTNRASVTAQELGLGARVRYEQGVAEALAFADGSFDLVTCQTLLIHVASPSGVITEMVRVAKPGGLILAVEPNNRASLLVDETSETPIDDLLERLRFELTCERGKIELGEGNNSIGDLLPGHLAEHGLTDIQAFICDKAAMLVAPYASPDQQALRNRALTEAAESTWGWDREAARRYFLAGGGSQDEFEAAWRRRLGENRQRASALTDGSLHTAGGNILYAVAGRKPGAAT
ncbi:MAG: methyltransferase domain-containing protein [Solirubrobacteraceae bacterium]